MKAIEILDWICRESIEGEFLNIIEVPEEGENEWEQNEDWWINQMGMYPPYPIEKGRYLYYYTSAISDEIDNGCYVQPNATIELSNEYILLYKVED